MLEKEDLKAIQTMMKETVDESVKKAVDKSVKRVVVDAIEKNNILIFDEMERYYQMNHRDILTVEAKMGELEDYYRIKKLEGSTVTILPRTTEQLQTDVEEIKGILRDNEGNNAVIRKK